MLDVSFLWWMSGRDCLLGLFVSCVPPLSAVICNLLAASFFFIRFFLDLLQVLQSSLLLIGLVSILLLFRIGVSVVVVVGWDGVDIRVGLEFATLALALEAARSPPIDNVSMVSWRRLFLDFAMACYCFYPLCCRSVRDPPSSWSSENN